VLAANHEQTTSVIRLSLIFRGIEGLRNAFEGRQFTIDGRLVGDIGEVIAALEYDIVLDETSQPNYDGATSDGRRVQVKATFKDQPTYIQNRS